MNQFNIQNVEFNVRSLVDESKNPASAHPKDKLFNRRPQSAAAGTKKATAVKTGGPLYGENRNAASLNAKPKPDPSVKETAEKPPLPRIKPSATPPQPQLVRRPQSAHATAPAPNNAGAAAANATTAPTASNSALPPRKSTSAANIPPQNNVIRMRETITPTHVPKNYRLSEDGTRVYHSEAWDCTTSGLRRDLLQIAQDETISSYRVQVEGVPPPNRRPRPLSAVEARLRRKETDKGKAGTVTRERLATFMRFNRSHNMDTGKSGRDSRARWSTQTYTDENDDRARPSLKPDYRSHTEFSHMMTTLRRSTEVDPSATARVIPTEVAPVALAPSVVIIK